MYSSFIVQSDTTSHTTLLDQPDKSQLLVCFLYLLPYHVSSARKTVVVEPSKTSKVFSILNSNAKHIAVIIIILLITNLHSPQLGYELTRWSRNSVCQVWTQDA